MAPGNGNIFTLVQKANLMKLKKKKSDIETSVSQMVKSIRMDKNLPDKRALISSRYMWDLGGKVDRENNGSKKQDT